MAKIHKCSFGRFVKDLQNENLSVWLFGCGEKGQNFVLKYRTTGIVSHIKGFIDNNPNQQGKMLAIESGKFPVISLQQFVNSKTEKDAILITSSYVLEILDQLQQIEELQNMPCYIDYLLEELYEPQVFLIEASKKQIIPKQIHYCWFGKGEIPEQFRLYMESWKKYCPDYKVIRWDETNYDVRKCQYAKEAYENGKWAFVSDYARIDILNEYGGIYLDTDVELIKNLDVLLSYDFFCGFERNNYINFGLGFGSVAHHPILEYLINIYNGLHFLDGKEMNLTPCAVYQLDAILKYGFKHDNRYQVINNTAIFPSEVFAPENTLQIESTVTAQTRSIHHYSSTWWDKGGKSELAKMREKVVCSLTYKS